MRSHDGTWTNQGFCIVYITEKPAQQNASPEHDFLWNAINAFIHYFSLKKNDFSLKRNHFSLKINHFSLKINHFSLKKNHFSLKINHFSLKINHFSLKKNRSIFL